MNKLRVFEAFSGYGSQSISLDNIGISHDVVATSEIDADAIIAYGAIRYDLDTPIDKTDDEIKKYLMDRNIGYDFQKQKSSIPKMKKVKLYKLYNAAILSNDLGDISIIDPHTVPDHDLFTMSSPCQDFSVAGKQEGGSWKCISCDKEFNPIESDFEEVCPHCQSIEIKKTKSSLLFECAKNIRVKKPKYILLENVKNLVGVKHIDTFNRWKKWLEGQGYFNYHQVLNAKDYTIPQNRERIFMISVLNEDIDYRFPEKATLELRLKDILEDVVDEKYYIDSEKCKTLISQLKDKNSLMLDMCQAKREGKPREYTDISPTLSARDWKEPRLINCSLNIIKVGNLECSYEQSGRVYSSDGISPTVMSNSHGKTSGGYTPIKVLEYPEINEQIQNNSSVIKLFDIPKEIINDNERQRRVYSCEGVSPTILARTDNAKILDTTNNCIKVGETDSHQKGGIYSIDGISRTLLSSDYKQPVQILDDLYANREIREYEDYSPTLRSDRFGLKVKEDYRIRKLTPKECFRLMGMKDEDFQKCVDAGISNSQLYKLAGNSIVVPVLIAIFRELFKSYIDVKILNYKGDKNE